FFQVTKCLRILRSDRFKAVRQDARICCDARKGSYGVVGDVNTRAFLIRTLALIETEIFNVAVQLVHIAPERADIKQVFSRYYEAPEGMFQGNIRRQTKL